MLIRSYGQRDTVDAVLDDCGATAATIAAELSGGSQDQVRHRALFDVLVSALQIRPFIHALGAAEYARMAPTAG